MRDDDDAVWEDLVARIGPLRPPSDPDDHAPPREEGADGGPASDEGASDEPPAARPATLGGPRDHAPAAPAAAGTTGAHASQDDPADDREDDRYVPADAPPLTSAGVAWWAPWIALVGAPLVLAVAALTRSSVPGWLVMTCVAVFAGGAVVAVLRLPSAPTQDPGDDGARL